MGQDLALIVIIFALAMAAFYLFMRTLIALS